MGDTIDAISRKLEYLKRSLLVLLLPLISSCMHTGMMGESGGHHSSDDSLFEKEVTVDGVRVNAVIPQMEVGRSSELTVKLSHDSTRRPLSHARIQLSVMQGDGTATAESSVPLMFNETGDEGAYAIQYEASRSGPTHVEIVHLSAWRQEARSSDCYRGSTGCCRRNE